MPEPDLQKFLTCGVYPLYQNRTFLNRPQMKQAIRGLLKQREVIIEDPIKFLTIEKGVITTVSTIWNRVKLRIIFILHPAYQNRFKDAATIIDRAFRDSVQEKISRTFTNTQPVNNNSSTPAKEEVSPADLKAFEELSIRIQASKKNQEDLATEIKQEKAYLEKLNEAHLKLREAGCQLADIVDEQKENFKADVVIIEKILKLAKEYKSAPCKYWGFGNIKDYDLTYFNEFLDKQGLAFDFTNVDRGINWYQNELAYSHNAILFLEQIDLIKESEAKLKELQSKVDASTEELSKQMAELNVLSKKCQLKLPDFLPPSETVDTTPIVIEEKPIILNPEQVFHEVMRTINHSIDGENSSQEAKAFQREAQFSFMEKCITTPNLQMGGMNSIDISKQKLALVIQTLSKALCEKENNKKIQELIANVICAITNLDPKVSDSDKVAIREFILYVFGLNSNAENPEPNLNEGYRYRIILFLFAAGINLAHYYFEPDFLESSYKMIKHLEGGKFYQRWTISAGKLIFKGKIDNVTHSILDIPILKDNDLRKSQALTFIKVFSPIGEDLLFAPDSLEIKNKMKVGVKHYADGDLKEFMDKVSFDKPLTPTKMTDECVKLFGNFIEKIK